MVDSDVMKGLDVYKRQTMVYSFYQLLWLYMIYSFIGWCGEVAVAAVKRHRFVNRGAVSGPFCPIYGLGAAVVAVFFPELKGNPLLLFLGGMVVNTFVEYVTGRIMAVSYTHLDVYKRQVSTISKAENML